MKSHMQDGHEAHVGKSNDEQHQEGNGGIVVIRERIKNSQSKICTKAQFENWHDAGSTQILLSRPAVRLAFNSILRSSFEAALNAQQRFHNRFRITDR